MDLTHGEYKQTKNKLKKIEGQKSTFNRALCHLDRVQVWIKYNPNIH